MDVGRIRAKREESFFRRVFSRMRVLECDLKAVNALSDLIGFAFSPIKLS